MPKGDGLSNVLTGLATGLPIVGSFASAALQQKYALKNWERQNAYNHPKEQIKRLKEAGLPLAAMFSGSGGSSTSQSIDNPNVDSNLGTAEGIQKGLMFQMQKKQMELLQDQIYTEKGRGAREWTEAYRSKTQADKEANEVYGYQLVPEGMEDQDTQIFSPATNQIRGLQIQREQQIANKEATVLSNEIQRIKEGLTKEQMRAEIDRILVDITAHKGYAELRDQVIKDLTKGGAGWKGIQRLIAAFLLKSKI